MIKSMEPDKANILSVEVPFQDLVRWASSGSSFTRRRPTSATGEIRGLVPGI